MTLKSKDGSCPKCGSEDYTVVVACHIGSMYDDSVKCNKCGEVYDCYQGNYKKS
jgi:uncharacterized Zn finger protein